VGTQVFPFPRFVLVGTLPHHPKGLSECVGIRVEAIMLFSLLRSADSEGARRPPQAPPEAEPAAGEKGGPGSPRHLGTTSLSLSRT
jgi:hypothetical protein